MSSTSHTSGVVFEDDGDSTAFVTNGGGMHTTLSLSSTTRSHSQQKKQSTSTVRNLKLELNTTGANLVAGEVRSSREHRIVLRDLSKLPTTFTCDGRDASSVPGASAVILSGDEALEAAGAHICRAQAAPSAKALVVSCGLVATDAPHVIVLAVEV